MKKEINGLKITIPSDEVCPIFIHAGEFDEEDDDYYVAFTWEEWDMIKEFIDSNRPKR